MALPNGSNGSHTVNDEENQAVMEILDQLAMYDVPQTRVNPNPERPLLRLENSDIVYNAGAEPSKGRF